MEITGRIKLINDLQTFESGFQKKEFVVTTNEQYPQDIKLECIKDRISLLDDYKSGDEVSVSFNLKGNEYKGRYYINLHAWKIAPNDSQGESVSSFASFPEDETPLPVSTDMPEKVEENDDLPF